MKPKQGPGSLCQSPASSSVVLFESRCFAVHSPPLRGAGWDAVITPISVETEVQGDEVSKEAAHTGSSASGFGSPRDHSLPASESPDPDAVKVMIPGCAFELRLPSTYTLSPLSVNAQTLTHRINLGCSSYLALCWELEVARQERRGIRVGPSVYPEGVTLL